MKFLRFFGANCHLLSLINIAVVLKTSFFNSFARLWSEVSFTNNSKHNVHISKRVFEGFKSCGISIKKTAYESIPYGSFFLIGMDTFFIPWSPVYQNFNGTHYFFAKKEKNGTILCFDPTYNKKNIRISVNEIIPYAFDICSVTSFSNKIPTHNIEDEAREALKNLSDLQKSLCKKIQNCKNKKRLAPIIKQIIALTSNRFMFKCYLQNTKSRYCRFFNKTLFNKWFAIKNGLIKATIQKNNSKTLDEVCQLIENVLKKEIKLANKILNLQAIR